MVNDKNVLSKKIKTKKQSPVRKTLARILKQEEKEKKTFRKVVKTCSLFDLFQIYNYVSEADGWDGAFSPMQEWKKNEAGVEMRERLVALEQKGIK